MPTAAAAAVLLMRYTCNCRNRKWGLMTGGDSSRTHHSPSASLELLFHPSLITHYSIYHYSPITSSVTTCPSHSTLPSSPTTIFTHKTSRNDLGTDTEIVIHFLYPQTGNDLVMRRNQITILGNFTNKA